MNFKTEKQIKYSVNTFFAVKLIKLVINEKIIMKYSLSFLKSFFLSFFLSFYKYPVGMSAMIQVKLSSTVSLKTKIGKAEIELSLLSKTYLSSSR